MSKFKKKRGNSTPAVSTASLPDIVFMLLFFFMVVTVIRQNEPKVEITVPRADQLRKLEDKSLTAYMFIGKPLSQYRPTYGDAPQLQLNDKFSAMSAIPFFLEEKKQTIEERLRDRIIASLRVDNDVTMGFVTDVKTELRKAGQLKVNYAATMGDVGEK